MKKKNKSSVQQFNYILSTISQCDVVLRNGNKQFIGLYYDSVKADAPYILCKEAASLSYCMYKYLETIGVLCVDNALLTKEIFENVQEGDLLPPVYFDRVAVIYSNLAKYKDTSKESFHIKLNKDVVYPHSFRHRFAKNFLDRFNDLALLADLMGHESIETTRIYLRRTASEQQALVDKIVTW